jgi:formylglycine-generating enzyme required for sulfatase activity
MRRRMTISAWTVTLTTVALSASGQSTESTWPTPKPCPPESEWPAGMACVQGGAFMLGDERGRPDERAPGMAYVDTFYMDRTEVTNAQYAPCIESGKCKKPMPFRGFGRPEQPVVAVSWFDAVAHCEMIGKRLPTDAEWERAAGGPNDTRYPWGDEAGDCSKVVVKTEDGEGCGTGKTAKVGSRPAGHWGLFDMAGNVHEWVYDHYASCLRGCDKECGDACFGVNPKGPCGGENKCPGFGMRSVRGGSWYWTMERARVSARRGSGAPNLGPHRFGFRCAKAL